MRRLQGLCLPLLFLKRLSDVFDEEREMALEESDGDEEYATSSNTTASRSHPFHWNHLRTRNANVGQAIKQAMRDESEPENPLRHFGDAQWTNKNDLR